MDDRRWERLGALGGVVFVVMMLVTAFLPGDPPATGDPPSEVVRWIVDHGDEIRWAGYLGALAVLPLFWWVGSLWRLLRRAEGGTPRLAVTAVLGVSFAAVAGAVSGVMLAVLATSAARGLDEVQLQVLYLLATDVGFVSLFGIAAFVGASSIVFVRSRAMPAALGWFGLAVSAVAVVAGYGAVSTRDALMVVAFLAYLGAMLWVLVTSILMFRSGREPAPS